MAHTKRLSFNDWQLAVHKMIARMCGLSVRDLADWKAPNLRHMYEAGMPADKAAKQTVRIEMAPTHLRIRT